MTSLTHRSLDFWLLGGASIAIWIVLVLAQPLREQSEQVGNHFLQLGSLFAILSLVCNYPHFMISYRFAYGRGLRFVARHWFKLLVVPVSLCSLFIFAYLNFDSTLLDYSWVSPTNTFLEWTGLDFRFGTLTNLGTELLGLSVWIMYLTVGWHYSKQIFGCVMVYAAYDKYRLTKLQRQMIKASLFSVAFFNFFESSIYRPGVGLPDRQYFFSIPLISLGLPQFLIPLSGVITVLLFLGVIYFVFVRNFQKSGVRPSLNLVVPWLSFYFWWIPFVRQPEYYFLAVPFFHSLQYLPFAYRIERSRIKSQRWFDLNVSLRVLILLIVGFCAFEFVPGLLDKHLETFSNLKALFFTISFAVFINVHHFFIDSAIWKLDDHEVRASLF